MQLITWIRHLNLQQVIIEVESKHIVDCLANDSLFHRTWVHYSLVGAAKKKIKTLHVVQYFVWIHANQVAHIIARASRSFDSHHGVDFIPSCIEFSILNKRR